ncbi:MAG: hypothetical protein RL522_1005 [Pseudomonadota bacterium]
MALASVGRPRPPPHLLANKGRDGVSSEILWAALALVLVFEGLFPLLAPGRWRRTFERLTELKDGQLRFFGLVSVGLGLALLAWATAG